MFGLSSPLERLKKRINKIESLILSAEHNSKRKLESISAYNIAIKRTLDKSKKLLYKCQKGDKIDPSILPSINASLNSIYTNIESIEKEIEENKDELKELMGTDEGFVNKFLEALTKNYKNSTAHIKIIDDLIEKSQKTKTIKEDVQKAENIAQQYIKNRNIPDKPRDLKKIARACGYITIEGENAHTIVRTLDGKKITEIPNHPKVKQLTSKKILKSMAQGKLVKSA